MPFPSEFASRCGQVLRTKSTSSDRYKCSFTAHLHTHEPIPHNSYRKLLGLISGIGRRQLSLQ